MKSKEKMDVKKEILLVTLLFTICGFALFQFTRIQDPVDGRKKLVKNKGHKTILTSAIQEPLDKKIAFKEFEFDVADGINAHMNSGTNVIIPKNSLVDPNGMCQG